MIFVIIVPFLGVFIYLIAENKGMTERSIERAEASQQQFDDYVRGDRFKRRRRRGDREGEATAGQRRDHTGRVRRDEGESAWVSHWPSGAGHGARARGGAAQSGRDAREIGHVTLHARRLDRTE